MNPAENQVPAVWSVGEVILDLYEVKNIHEGGGMGLVYRVHHRGWNMDLAVKSPRLEFFQTKHQKETFVRECETWINLGLHPHVASCYYVRTLGNIPRIFAEYVEGGTLREWIDSRKLYEGGPQVALKRILDIAIQIAWGLQYAHEQGLIHQDVKPANVLMTPEGAAKVTDFGLANARAAAGESSVGAGHRSIFVSSGGMTPAYCSPEQAEAYAKRVAGISTGDLPKLTRRTDIWSWGVTVLEMFIGEVCWQSGVAAPIVLQQYQELKRAISPDIPTLLYQLLSECFEFQPDRRPGQFSEIANRVRATFEKIYETTHPRELSAQVPANADLLNNQALSMVDLGRAFDPAPLKGGGKDFYSLLLKALSSNPGHIIARLNHSLFNWRMVGTNVAVSQRTVQNDLRGNLNSDLAKWGASLLAEQFQPRLAIAFLRQFPDGLDYRLTEDLEKLAANLKAALRDYFNTESEFSETPETFFSCSQNATWVACASRPIAPVTNCVNVIVRERNSGKEIFCAELKGRQLAGIALSESGCTLVAATFKTGLSPLPNASTSEEPYEVEIWDVLNRTKRASFHGRSESRSRNLSLAVDDAGLNIFVWPRDSPFDEFTHPFDQASGVYQSYAPRELPRFLQFDVAVLSGDGKRLLLATKNGFVEVWECEHARRKFCRLSLNLKQFGLLRISEYLPRFDLDHAFDFEISQFNAYSLLSVLDHLQNPFRAAFLIAKPSDSKKLFDESALRREWERDADVARASGNAKISVALLDRCIHHESADQERIVEKRQAIAFACARRTLAEVRQISEEEQYWELPLSAICSPAPGEFDVLTRGVYQESGAKASIRRCFFPPSQGVKGWQRDQRDFYVNEKDASCDPLLSLPAGVGLFRVNYYVRDKFKLVAALNAKSAESLWELPLRKHFSLDQVCFAAGSVWALLDTNRLSQLDAESGRVTASFEFREPIARIEKFVTDQAAEMLFLSPESASRCYFLNPKTSEMREHALGFPNGWEVIHLPQSRAVIGRSPMFGIVYFRSLLPDGGERDWTWKSPREDVSFVKPTACGRAIAFMTPCKFQIWDIETSRSVFEWGIHDLKDYAFDASGRWLLMAASLHRLERFELFWNPS